ncbi:MAG: hypothetical protein R3Y45_02740 [Bacillota bacterium]
MNKKMRLIIVSMLIFALVLSMVGCSSDVLGGGEEVSYEATTPSVPVATTAPTAVATETPIESAEVVTSETAVQVVDTDEAQLEIYGITFPTFDSLVYTTDTSEMAENMSFGVDIDQMNLYQEAYNFEITAKISAVDFEGNSISKSKFAADAEYVATYLGVTSDDYDLAYYGYNDAGNIGDWTRDDTFVGKSAGGTDNYYFTVGRAGVYTVEYTVEIEFEDAEYGYLVPDELEEKYTITKTYTVEKAELALETTSDAFQVDSSMFFADSTIDLSDAEKAVLNDEDLKTSVEVTSCDGTEVGEYPLSITITDDDGNVVDPSDIVLSNYYVTVSEGTRYILSAEDVAKANAIRKMAYDDENSEIPLTAEYSQETIDYYNNLTDGQKVLAAVDTGNDEWERISEYLVEYIPVLEDDIDEAEYNTERTDLIDEIEDLIDAYMTASTQRVKDDYLTELAITLQLIDNEGHEYGSDLLYALGELVTGVYVPAGAYDDEGKSYFDKDFNYADSDEAYGYMTFEEVEKANITPVYHYDGYNGAYNTVGFATEFDMEDTNTIYAIVIEGANVPYYMVSFKVDYDDETETYSVDFDYSYSYEEVGTSCMGSLGSDKSAFEVNAVYDAYLYEYAANGAAFMEAMRSVMTASEFSKDVIDDLSDALDSVVSSSGNLLDYQKAYTFSSGETYVDYTDYFVAIAQRYVDRWNAYVEFIESFEFEYSYIDNANQEDLSATYLAVQQVLGYSFVNSNLVADMTYEGSLVETLFTSAADEDDDIFSFGLETPELFAYETISAYGDIVDVLQTVQAETDLVKQELINYIVSTGYYTSDFNKEKTVSEEDYSETLITDLENAAILYGESGEYSKYVYTVTYKYDSGAKSFDVVYTYYGTSKDVTDDDIEYKSGETYTDTDYGDITISSVNVASDTTIFTADDISIDNAYYLDELLAWVDYQVLAEMLYEDDSAFWKDYSKKGLDEAMNEMFEEIIEAVQDRVDVIDAVLDTKEDVIS